MSTSTVLLSASAAGGHSAHGKAVSTTSSRVGCGRRCWRSSTAIPASAALLVRCGPERQSSAVASTSYVILSGRAPSMPSRRSAMTFIVSRTPPVPERRGARTCVSSACGPNVALASWPVFGKAATSCSRSSPSPRRSVKRSGPPTRSHDFTIERLHEEFRRRVKREALCRARTRPSCCSSASWRAGKSGCGELTVGRRSPPCSGSRPREPHDEAAFPQLSPCFGFESGGDPDATLHGLARHQGEADPLVEL